MRPKDMNRPNMVYRYVSLNNVDRLQELFVESQLYFAKPSQFNDPFEFKPKRMSTDTSGLEASLVKKYFDPSLDTLYEGVCNELDKYGVCCFSELRDNIIMWSHYSDGHTGACIGFETNNDFFNRLRPVDYRPERHDIDLKHWEPRNIVFEVMLRKHRSWCYEKEWRLLQKPGGEPVAFPPEALKSVIFGAHCPQPRQKLVKTLLGERIVELHTAQIDKYEYKLNVLPCP